MEHKSTVISFITDFKYMLNANKDKNRAKNSYR